ncbi:unnamed protein product [Protopolystoma xenopodis]|uniref:Uncharacterized protein n=1 Tax=Protopolystoma xenopodis TaxID=117903 RepID=A0A3S5B0Z5_9PLAT|nr:unnamed protein product [Protopolystoma xenopodis]
MTMPVTSRTKSQQGFIGVAGSATRIYSHISITPTPRQLLHSLRSRQITNHLHSPL